MAAKTSRTQAPGDLWIVQNFVNIAERGQAKEQLSSPQALGDYLTGAGLLPPGTELGEGELRWATAIRKGLRLLLRVNEGKSLDPESIERLNQALTAKLQVRLKVDGSVGFVPVSSGFDGVVERLLAIVAEAQRDGTWSHLKLCLNPSCGQAFYHPSHPGIAKWCSRRCGNQVNARIRRRRYGSAYQVPILPRRRR